MNYETINNGVIVPVIRKITKGRQYRIVASYGYAGIVDGIVRVEHIIDPEVISKETGVYEDYGDMIESYIGAELGSYDIEDSISERDRAYDELVNQPWVVYSYEYGPNTQNEYYVFPLDQFVTHTIQTL